MKKTILLFALVLPLSSPALTLSTASCQQLANEHVRNAIEAARLYDRSEKSAEGLPESEDRRFYYASNRAIRSIQWMMHKKCDLGLLVSDEEIKRRAGVRNQREFCLGLLDRGDYASYHRNKCGN